jgi:hypothetical protein
MKNEASPSTCATSNRNVMSVGLCSQFMNEASRRRVVYHSISRADNQARLCPCALSTQTMPSNSLQDTQTQSTDCVHHTSTMVDRPTSSQAMDSPSLSEAGVLTATVTSTLTCGLTDAVNLISVDEPAVGLDIGAVCEEEEDIDDDPLADYERVEDLDNTYSTPELSSAVSPTVSTVSTQFFSSPMGSAISSEASTILSLLTNSPVTPHRPAVNVKYACGPSPLWSPDMGISSPSSTITLSSPMTLSASASSSHLASTISSKLLSTAVDRHPVIKRFTSQTVPVSQEHLQNLSSSISSLHATRPYAGTQQFLRPTSTPLNLPMSAYTTKDKCDRVTDMSLSVTTSSSSPGYAPLVPTWNITVNILWREVSG